MKTVAVLCTRRKSSYLQFAEADCFDEMRDAFSFNGSLPVVGHPPCRSWGRLHHLAKPSLRERDLAFYVTEMVQKNGGVLEHPAGSKLWEFAGLPRPGATADKFGGVTLSVFQGAYGHPAPKHTWLYCVRCSPGEMMKRSELVTVPYRSVESQSTASREKTPLFFAAWLIDLAISAASKID